MWAMLPQPFGLFSFIFEVDGCAVETFASGTMVAFGFRFVILVLFFLFLITAKAVETLSSRGMVTFGRNALFSSIIKSGT